MKVEITDASPDIHTLHRGHMLFDAFDMVMLAYAVTFVASIFLCLCTCWRLRRKDPITDSKKAE